MSQESDSTTAADQVQSDGVSSVSLTGSQENSTSSSWGLGVGGVGGGWVGREGDARDKKPCFHCHVKLRWCWNRP